MLNEIAFWIYFANAVLLIDHEIDSAYWKEWELFGMKGGIGMFLLLHVPMLGLILYGMVEISRGTLFGVICSILLGAGGIFAFCIHTYFIRKGWGEFNTTASLAILYSTLIVSLAQLGVSIYMIMIR